MSLRFLKHLIVSLSYPKCAYIEVMIRRWLATGWLLVGHYWLLVGYWLATWLASNASPTGLQLADDQRRISLALHTPR